MGKALAHVTLLLIQARRSLVMEQQEQDCFLERCRLEPRQLISINVDRDRIDRSLLDTADVLMIGGAGSFSAVDDHTWMPDLVSLIQAADGQNIPTFGSCWGHQIIARALGGTVVHDAGRAELGCHEVELTDDGREDRLFRDFPPRFSANMGHHDRVVQLPPGGVELARNQSQPYQAFRIRDKPIYGTQFHSELDAQREKERLVNYRAYYQEQLPDDASFQRVLDSLADTTEVDHLLLEFLLKFVVHHPDVNV